MMDKRGRSMKRSHLIGIIFFVVLVLFCHCCGICGESRQIKAVVKDVIYETEEGFVSTSRGEFALPNPSTEVFMDGHSLTILIQGLKKRLGKESVLCLDGKTVVGISAENGGTDIFPAYRKKQKIVYSKPPVTISTILKRWEADTYRLMLATSDGVFCVFNEFEVSDYYRSVHEKLKACGAPETNLDIKVLIFYHKIENSYECRGEIERIEFINDGNTLK